jgi:hypothetical protein
MNGSGQQLIAKTSVTENRFVNLEGLRPLELQGI